MNYEVPGVGEIEIKVIVLDLNGTLSVNGQVPDGVKQRLDKLNELGIEIVLFTGDQRGTAQDLCDDLGISFVRCKSLEEKEKAMGNYDSETTAAIGNARIDIGTFKKAKVSVATLQAEGIHAGILEHVDVVVPTINDALDFFIDTNTFAATMRM
ncbi:HAD hydrolase family protein [candidate division WWE3 bacterium]|uniref:HAD hydrolase family protein n=1 Tax=candidate division WWE3 bacterium TaxID=2053526 RepID=A0A955RRL3_UNCKA|nr:HAD hydrolase family protein [candidate division WWE3 bacterium]